ncbi:MAG TPA: hypothetical protein VLL76_08845 [Candidatus Omnitrophota bacterium]|nr:hypothetical protein [Candidatus Omnitrophota bacterium]
MEPNAWMDGLRATVQTLVMSVLIVAICWGLLTLVYSTHKRPTGGRREWIG